MCCSFELFIPSVLYKVVGHKEGLDVMERADPLFLLIGLPTIPVMLILGKMIRWEDYVLRLWRKYSNKLQILNSIFPGQATLPPLFLLLIYPFLNVHPIFSIQTSLDALSFQGLAAQFLVSLRRPAPWQTMCQPRASCVEPSCSQLLPPSWGSSCSAASTPTYRGPS